MNRPLKFLAPVALAIAALAPAAPARADLEWELFVNGNLIADTLIGPTSPFIDQQPGDTNLTPKVLVPDVTVINSNPLVAPFFHFNSISTSSNAGLTGNALLSQTVDVQTYFNGTNLKGGTIQAFVTDTGYMIPPNPATMTNSLSATPSNMKGQTETQISWFNPSNAEFATDIPSPPATVTLNSMGVSSNTMAVTPPITPFGLTDSVAFAMQGSTAGSKVHLGTTSSTLVQGVVPEPSTWLGAGIGLLTLAGYGWRRRRASV
jgi:hypothetical protein